MVAPVRSTFMVAPMKNTFINNNFLAFSLLKTCCWSCILMLKGIMLGPNNIESSYKHESYLQIQVILYFYELQSTCLFHISLDELP